MCLDLCILRNIHSQKKRQIFRSLTKISSLVSVSVHIPLLAVMSPNVGSIQEELLVFGFVFLIRFFSLLLQCSSMKIKKQRTRKSTINFTMNWTNNWGFVIQVEEKKAVSCKCNLRWSFKLRWYFRNRCIWLSLPHSICDYRAKKWRLNELIIKQTDSLLISFIFI